MVQIPPKESIQETLLSAWQFDGTLTPVPSTKRLFSFRQDRSKFFARLNWARGQLSAEEVVEFVDHLGKSSAPVPRIVPTPLGDLCVAVGDDVVLSVETDLGGQPCSSRHLYLLGEVGRGLARIHQASEKFGKTGMREMDLSDYIRENSGALFPVLFRTISTTRSTAFRGSYKPPTRT